MKAKVTVLLLMRTVKYEIPLKVGDGGVHKREILRRGDFLSEAWFMIYDMRFFLSDIHIHFPQAIKLKWDWDKMFVLLKRFSDRVCFDMFWVWMHFTLEITQ